MCKTSVQGLLTLLLHPQLAVDPQKVDGLGLGPIHVTPALKIFMSGSGILRSEEHVEGKQFWCSTAAKLHTQEILQWTFFSTAQDV